MAKYALTFIIVLVFLAGFLLFFYSKESYKLLPIQQEKQDVNLASYNFQDWHEFTSPKKDFKVLLPSLPQHATENLIDQKTKESRKYEMFVSQKDDGTVFMISLITFPKDKAKGSNDQLMRTMMNDMMASNPSNELHESKSGKFKEYESLDFSFGNKELRVDARTFMIDSTLYVLSRVVKTPQYNANEYNFFINSFDLTSQTIDKGDANVTE